MGRTRKGGSVWSKVGMGNGGLEAQGMNTDVKYSSHPCGLVRYLDSPIIDVFHLFH